MVGQESGWWILTMLALCRADVMVVQTILFSKFPWPNLAPHRDAIAGYDVRNAGKVVSACIPFQSGDWHGPGTSLGLLAVRLACLVCYQQGGGTACV